MSESTIHPVSGHRSYLIVVSEMLVAQDIAQTISDFDASANVIFARSTAEAQALLARTSCIAVAFVAIRPQSFVGSTLAGAIAERGGRVVLLGIEAEVTGRTSTFDVLPQPFDTVSLLRRLRAVERDEPAIHPCPLAIQSPQRPLKTGRRDSVLVWGSGGTGHYYSPVQGPPLEGIRTENEPEESLA